MYFDTHAHYDDGKFDPDRQDLLASLPQNDVSLMVNIGCDLQSSQQSLAFAQAHPHIYAAVGFHPGEVKGVAMEENLSKIKAMAQEEKVKAIGEIGLDYHWEDNAPKEEQQRWFHNQMELAEELSLPVIIHDREAHQDSLTVVQSHPKVRGVFHCYSGSVEFAKNLLDLGYMLSFTGVITYKNAKKTREVLEYLPLDRIMLETDAPYLSPEPNRGKRNDSRNLPYIAQTVADIKGISLEECAKITKENGKRFFQITE